MTAKRNKKKRAVLNLEEVLSGKVAATALELVRLIHKINPTDKNLSSKKVAQQYRLKALLQSLLINKFNDSLLVEQPDSSQPQLIGIKLKHFSEDACHTLLHELDPEAVSWVRSQIDGATDQYEINREENRASEITSTGKKEPVAAALPETAAKPLESNSGKKQKEEFSPNELLKLGNRAFEEYDYEATETFFYRAFSAAPNNLEIALNLFNFLVDSLAAYEKVVDYSATLPDRIKTCEPVRILRARALARCGDIDNALKCLGKTDHPDAAKVYLLGARHFLQKGDLERAAQHINLLQLFTEPELKLETDKLIDDIHQLKIENLAPLEKAMLAAQQQGKTEKAAQLAQELLTEWPENRAARQIRHNFTEQRKALEKSGLWQRADNARAQKDFALEIEMLKKLSALNQDDEKFKQRLLEAETKADKKLQESKIDKVLKLLDNGSEKEVLENYASLDRKLRQELINRTGKSQFSQIELIFSEQPNLKPVKIAEAILELEECHNLLTQGDDPQNILLRLQNHEKILRPLSETAKLRQQAKMIQQKIKTDKTTALLKQASTQMAQKELSATRKLIDRVDLIALENFSKSDRKLYEDICTRLTKEEDIRRLEQNYADSERTEDHLRARNLARSLSLKKSHEASLWQAKETLHCSCISTEWSLTECDVENLPRCYNLAPQRISHKECYVAVMADQERLVTVLNFGEWLIVGIFSLAQQTYRKTILMRTPKELDFPDITLANDLIWINGCSGELVELSLKQCEIISWHDFSDLIEDNTIVEDICFFPKAGYLWIGCRRPQHRGADINNIIRLEHHRSERQVKLSGFTIKVRKEDNFQVLAPSLVYDSDPQIVQLYSVQGRNIGALPSLGPGKIVFAAATHPNGRGYVLLSHRDIEVENEDGFDEPENDNQQLIMEILPGDKEDSTFVKIEHSHGEMTHGIYSLPHAGLVFVYCSDSSRQNSDRKNHQLLAFKFSGTRCNRLYRINVPAELTFVTDESNSKIIALDFNTDNVQKDCVQAIDLGENPPEFIDDSSPDFIFGKDLPSFVNTLGCGEPTGPMKAEALALMLNLQNSSAVAILTTIATFKIDKSKNPDEIISLIMALKRETHFEQAYKLEEWFRNEHPDHPRTLIHRATRAIEKNEWQDAISHLEELSISALDDGSARHICHLLGIALLAQGRVKKALSILEQGRAREDGDCELQQLINYLKSTPFSIDVELKLRLQDKNLSSLEIYQRVDNKLCNKDWFAVITIMENFNIAKLFDLQILARLSEAYLHHEVRPKDTRWLGKVMVLASFCDLNRKNDILSNNQLLPPWLEIWSITRIQEIAKKAALWLDEIG